MKTRKVLLIYPNYPIPLDVKGFSVPLGILHLGTFLRSKGYEPKLIDTTIEENYYEVIEKNLPDSLCVGISAKTSQLPHAVEIAKKIKEHNREMPIILGGVHATLFPNQTLKNSLFDYTVMREGEFPLLNLLNMMHDRDYEKLPQTRGIGYKNASGEIFVNQADDRFDYSEMPSIDYSLLNPIVIETYRANDRIYFPLQTARGCPHKCSFCINVLIKDYRLYKAWSPERTVSEIERILKFPKRGTHRVTLFDENTFVNKKRIERMMDIIAEKGLTFEWYSSARADYFKKGFLDVEFLKKAYNCGARRISIGVESGSDQILSYLTKDIKVEDILRSSDYCRESNIRPSYGFMIGLPSEGEDDILQTIKLIHDISEKLESWGIVGPQLYRPYPGSVLYDECRKAGLKEPQSVEEWIKHIEDENRILDARKLPWIKNPKMVNVVHFYSAIIAVGYPKLIKIFNEYCDMTKRGLHFRLAGLFGVLTLSFLGKTRLKLNYYDFFLEKNLFDRIRRTHLSF